MSDDDLLPDIIPASLRDALRLAPDNAPLLLHVADIALRNGAFAAAESLFKRTLAIQPRHAGAQVGLASAFYQQGKFSAALVLVEELEKNEPPSARVQLLHARLALQAGEEGLAARHYQQAVQLDPGSADQALEQQLPKKLIPQVPPAPKRISPQPPSEFSDTSEEDENGFKFSTDTDQPFPEREALPAGDLSFPDAQGEIERPSVTFADVGGMEPVKEEIRMRIILPTQHPEMFKAYGKKAGGGVLMYGPPGCGKTFLARATAGEVKAGFLAIGINDVLDMWIGQSEKNLHALFEQARGNRPCVLFFDEVDALAANRTDMLKSAGRQIINQFLAELDGVASSNEGVLILAATNAPWHLDPAFRRPGRFDRILFVPPPDTEARAAILRLQLHGKPVREIDFVTLAKKTDGYSGADLRAVVETAVEAKLRAAMKSGKISPLETRDLLDALRCHKPTVRDWFETSRNYALYANQAGLYDDILDYLKIKH